MSKWKPIVKTCAKCKKPFSTADDSIIFCRACMDEQVKAEAKAELERQQAVVETKECPGCHKKFDITVGEKEYMEAHGVNPSPRFCKECRKVLRSHRKDVGREVVCPDCGKTFKISALAVLNNVLNGWDLPIRCPDCRKKVAEAVKAAREAKSNKGVYKTLTCKDCGKEFVVTNGEHKYLASLGYENDPVRCKECRHKRKVQAVIEDMRRIPDSDAMPADDAPLDVDAAGQQVGDPNVLPADAMPEAETPAITLDTPAAPAEPVWDGDAPIPAQAVDWAAENAPETGEKPDDLDDAVVDDEPAGEKQDSTAWTADENAILTTYYPLTDAELPARLPGRTRETCDAQAHKLGLAPQKPWTDEETEILKQWYPIEGTEVLRRLPGRTMPSCSAQVRTLGIEFFNGWAPEEYETLKECYARPGDVLADMPVEAGKAAEADKTSDEAAEPDKDSNAAADTKDEPALEMSESPANIPVEAETTDTPAAETVDTVDAPAAAEPAAPSSLAIDPEKVAELTKGLYPQDGEDAAAVDAEPAEKKTGFFGKLFGRD